MKRGLTAIFSDPDLAERAVGELVEIGVPRDWIQLRPSVLEDQVGPPTAAVTGAPRVALITGIAAAVVSAVVALLMTMGVIPARGFEFLGTSMVRAVARGAIAGGAAGGLFGYILGMGMWEDDGEPEAPVSAHEMVLTVRAGGQVEAVREVLERTGGRIG